MQETLKGRLIPNGAFQILEITFDRQRYSLFLRSNNTILVQTYTEWNTLKSENKSTHKSAQ